MSVATSEKAAKPEGRTPPADAPVKPKPKRPRRTRTRSAFPPPEPVPEAPPVIAPSPPATPPTAPGRPAAEQARRLGLALMPSMLLQAVNVQGDFDVTGYRRLLDNVLARAGGPTDPVEVMLIEQLVMAHFRSGKLQSDANAAKSPEMIRILNNAAARLLGEFRQTALALKSYRGRGEQAPAVEPPPS